MLILWILSSFFPNVPSLVGIAWFGGSVSDGIDHSVFNLVQSMATQRGNTVMKIILVTG